LSNAQPRKVSDLRRSQRVLLRVPIIVMGETSESTPFSEKAITLIVNAHGALISLGTKVTAGQKLGIVNLSSGEELECHVVHLGSTHNGETEGGIEFVNPAPFFWRISFPPSDWGSRLSP
jgi:hypothetical protein